MLFRSGRLVGGAGADADGASGANGGAAGVSAGVVGREPDDDSRSCSGPGGWLALRRMFARGVGWGSGVPLDEPVRLESVRRSAGNPYAPVRSPPPDGLGGSSELGDPFPGLRPPPCRLAFALAPGLPGGRLMLLGFVVPRGLRPIKLRASPNRLDDGDDGAAAAAGRGALAPAIPVGVDGGGGEAREGSETDDAGGVLSGEFWLEDGCRCGRRSAIISDRGVVRPVVLVGGRGGTCSGGGGARRFVSDCWWLSRVSWRCMKAAR